MRIIASFAAIATVAASIAVAAPSAEAQTFLAGAPPHFTFHGRSYCFSPAGWAGRGWYICGSAQRRGYGYGGPVGWLGHPGPGYGGPRFYGAYGGFHRGHGWRQGYGGQHGFGFGGRHGYRPRFQPMGGDHGFHPGFHHAGGFRHSEFPHDGGFRHREGGGRHGHPFRHHH